MIEAISALSVPMIAALAGAIMLFGKQNYFEAFVRGAKEGLNTAVRLLPTLSALLVAISMLSACGILDYISAFLAPLAQRIGVPSQLLPLLITRPFSGSASTAAYTALLDRVGADSFAGLCASVIFGSSDTVVYVITVYFSSVGIKQTRWSFPCAFAVMLFCVFFSCFLCRLCFF